MPLIPEYDPLTGKTFLTPGLKIGPYPGRLSVRQLQPGDVLVWYALGIVKKDRKTHTGIREATEGAYSHVGIYLGNSISIDAGPDGISKIHVGNLIKAFELGQVLRYRGLAGKRRREVLAKACSFDGYAYAKSDAYRMPFRRAAYRAMEHGKKSRSIVEYIGDYLIKRRLRSGPPKKSIYCSQMVVEAYGAANIYPEEVVLSAAISPNDLIENNDFEYMGFISKKTNPNVHPLDINADVQRKNRVSWKTNWFRLLRP